MQLRPGRRSSWLAIAALRSARGRVGGDDAGRQLQLLLVLARPDLGAAVGPDEDRPFALVGADADHIDRVLYS